MHPYVTSTHTPHVTFTHSPAHHPAVTQASHSPANDRNTFLAATSSSLSWRVISLRAWRSSVWSSPDSRTTRPSRSVPRSCSRPSTPSTSCGRYVQWCIPLQWEVQSSIFQRWTPNISTLYDTYREETKCWGWVSTTGVEVKGLILIHLTNFNNKKEWPNISTLSDIGKRQRVEGERLQQEWKLKV